MLVVFQMYDNVLLVRAASWPSYCSNLFVLLEDLISADTLSHIMVQPVYQRTLQGAENFTLCQSLNVKC